MDLYCSLVDINRHWLKLFVAKWIYCDLYQIETMKKTFYLIVPIYDIKSFIFKLVLQQFNGSEAKGLDEEFTWTRINFDWSQFNTVNSRGGFERSYYGGGSVKPKPTSGAILFPGPDNRNDKHKYPNNLVPVPSTTEGSRLNGNDQPPPGIDYQYENNIPMGANVWNNKLFITIPRRRLGVPSTLNYVDLNGNRKNPPLIPYPNAQINYYDPVNRDPQNFVSVYRVGVDPCDRLWFVDIGMIELPGNVTQVRTPTLIIIDLKTDQVILQYEFPQSNLRSNTNFGGVTVDVTTDSCQDAFAYLPDLAGYGLVVYSLRENRSWRVTHNYFYLESHSGEFMIAGHRFQWNDGVFSTELTAKLRDGSRDLYFHSMAGTRLYKVNTRVLRNESLATRSYHESDFEIVGDKGKGTQTAAADLHQPTGVLFLGLVNMNAVGCWKVGTDLKNGDLVHRDDNRMIYPSDVKIFKDRLYVLTNTMPEFLYGRLNYDEVNFRVWSTSVQKAIMGTRCN